MLVWGWVDSEKWPDATEGLLRHSEFFFFRNSGQGPLGQLYLLLRALLQLPSRTFGSSSKRTEVDPAAFSAGAEALRVCLQSQCEQADGLAFGATVFIQTHLHSCPVAMIFTFFLLA